MPELGMTNCNPITTPTTTPKDVETARKNAAPGTSSDRYHVTTVNKMEKDAIPTNHASE